jgi:predicted nucleic acid-binding Zn ribbon protein
MTESSPSPPMSTSVTATTAQPVANLPEHRHCEVCGRSTAMGVRVCSPDCQKRFDEALKMRKRSMWIFVALIALVMALSVFGKQIFGGQ